MKNKVLTSIVVACCLAVAVMASLFFFLRHNGAGVRKTALDQTKNETSTRMYVGLEAAGHIVEEFPAPRIVRLDAEQLRSLTKESAAVLSAYTSGSFAATEKQLLAIRGEVPPSWNNPFDRNHADRTLAWYYSSLSITDGRIQAIELSTANVDVTSPEYPSVAQDRNSAMGVHKDGLTVLSEQGGAPTVYEVQVPASYTHRDGTLQAAWLAVRMAWSKRQHRWIQVGGGLYGFPVGQSVPMMPY